jgi:hypothetical protein
MHAIAAGRNPASGKTMTRLDVESILAAKATADPAA